MAEHGSYLDTTCRLCGQKIKKGARWHILDRELIQTLFDVDISTDDPLIFPVKSCNPCNSQLAWTKTKSSITVEGGLHTFTPHQDTECICMTRRCYDSKNPRPFSFTCGMSKRKLIEAEAKSKGLMLINSGKAEDVYGKFDAEGGWSLVGEKMLLVQDNLCQLTYKKKLVSSLDFTAHPSAIIESFLSVSPCVGNDDFQDIISSKIDKDGLVKGKDGEIIGIIQSVDGSSMGDLCTIRSPKCSLLTDLLRCTACVELRSRYLHKRRSSLSNKTDAVPKTMRIDLMNSAQLQHRVRDLSKENKSLRRANNKLQAIVDKMVEVDGVQINGDLQKICSNVLDKETMPTFDEDSPAAFLWEQQKQALSKKKGMRWHLFMIRWCVSVYLKSAATYKH